MNQSPGTIHKVVMNSRGSADNLHSGISNQELDSVDDQAFQIELKNRLGAIPAPQSTLPQEEQDGKRSPKKQSEKKLPEKVTGNQKRQSFDAVGNFSKKNSDCQTGQIQGQNADPYSRDQNTYESPGRRKKSTASVGKGAVIDYVPTTINMNFDPFSKP